MDDDWEELPLFPDDDGDDDENHDGESSTPYQGDSDTSRESAAHMDSTGAHSRRLLEVWTIIRDSGEHGATLADIVTSAGLMHQTVSARISELRRPRYGRCWIMDSGARRVAPYSGRRQAVYIVNPRPLTTPPAP